MALRAARPHRPAAVRIRRRGSSATVDPPPEAPPTTVSALPRGVIVLLGIAGSVVAIAGMKAVADLLAPVLLALMLTVTVAPLTGWLKRLGTPTWLAALATVTTVYVLLAGLAGAMVVSLARLVDLVPTYQDRFNEIRASITDTLNGLGVSSDTVQEMISRTDPSAVLSLFQSLLSGLVGAITNAIFLLAVLLFMCFDATFFPDRLLGAARERPAVVASLRWFAQGTRRYLLVTTVFGLAVAVVDTIVLWAMGIPLPVLWGLLSFITNYIPNIGFIIGVIPPALLGLLEGGVEKMLFVIALYCLVNFVIQSIIQPKVVGDAVGLSTTMSFMSVIVWTWILGPLGALLAIPLTLLAKGLLIDADPTTRWINPLLSSADWEQPAVKDGPEQG